MSSADARAKRKRRSAKSRRGRERTAFITAPPATDTSVIRRLLEQQGVNTLAADELDLPGAPLSMVVMEAMGRADIVIGVLGEREESGNVLFELGVAQGLKKPTLLIAAKENATALGAATGIPYLRAEPDNFAALEFGLTQFLSAPHHGNAGPKLAQKETRPLGEYADALLARLHAHQEQGDQHPEDLLRDIIVEALEASGISTLSVGEKQGEARIDIAVWSNDLDPWIRNPLLMEVKKYLPGKGELDTLVKRFADALGSGSLNWALVIYGAAAPKAERVKHLHPHILLLSAEKFLESLRDTGFGDLVRKLRNERVHGRG